MNRRGFLVGGAAGAVGLAGAGSLVRSLLGVAAAGNGAPVRLNSNENALGLADSARGALVETLERANRYPFSLYGPLTEALAEHLGVKPENIALTNGSSEALTLAVQSFARSQGRVLVADPTFEAVVDSARARSLEIIPIRLESDYSHPLSAMEKKLKGKRTPTLIYICNPNNPTGTLTPVDDILRLMERAPRTAWFLIDEAYFEYVRDPGYRSLIPEAVERPNTLVTRTFSKIYAMAGLRLGYGVGHPKTVERLATLAPDARINAFAAAAGKASLSDAPYLSRSFKANSDAKAELTKTLDELGIEYLPSHTNFVLHRIKGHLEEYRERMKEKGFLVGRAFPPMDKWNRVSLGRPDQMQEFSQVLRSFRASGWV